MTVRGGWPDIRGDLSIDLGLMSSGEPIVGLQRHLVERIGGLIATAHYPEGGLIVPDEIASEHGVSRTVVREALKVLETKGMVSARPRAGTRVNPVEDWRLLDPDVIRWRSLGTDSARQIGELLAIRGAIEPLAAREASSHATPPQVQDLLRALERMQAAVDDQDWAAFTEADVEFHRVLLVSSGLQIMLQFVEPIEAALRVRHRLQLVPNRLNEGVVSSHRRIVEAIGAGDAAAAEAASRSIVDVAGAETVASLLHTDQPAES